MTTHDRSLGLAASSRYALPESATASPDFSARLVRILHRVLQALHDSRRRQADLEIRRHAHLLVRRRSL